MKTCIKCGSHAFNLYAEGIDQGGFCDVHYWQGRAHRAEAQPEKEPVAEAYALADKVRTELDKKCCPVAYMNVAWEAVVTNYRDLIHTTPPKHLWVDLTDEEISEYLGHEYHTATKKTLYFFKLGLQAAKEKNT